MPYFGSLLNSGECMPIFIIFLLLFHPFRILKRLGMLIIKETGFHVVLVVISVAVCSVLTVVVGGDGLGVGVVGNSGDDGVTINGTG